MSDESVAVPVPIVTFLYTLDQIAGMVQMPLNKLRQTHIYFHLRSTGRKQRHQLLACNIAADDKTPDWRVTHQDFVRWLKANGFQVKELGSL